MTFQKPMFSLSKTYYFEVKRAPKHEKNESESDVETKSNFRVIFDRCWTQKGSYVGLILELFSRHVFDHFFESLFGAQMGQLDPTVGRNLGRHPSKSLALIPLTLPLGS